MSSWCQWLWHQFGVSDFDIRLVSISGFDVKFVSMNLMSGWCQRLWHKVAVRDFDVNLLVGVSGWHQIGIITKFDVLFMAVTLTSLGSVALMSSQYWWLWHHVNVVFWLYTASWHHETEWLWCQVGVGQFEIKLTNAYINMVPVTLMSIWCQVGVNNININLSSVTLTLSLCQWLWCQVDVSY
jgi:hypothetical protein